MTMTDVTALGELLIDFTSYGTSEAGNELFERNPGGAPANVLACLSKCGKKTAFIGKVGKDMHGRFLKGVLEDNGIDTAGLTEDEDTFTTLAFVSLNEKGERSFSFARKPGADTMLSESEIREDVIRDSRIFHVGSLSLTAEPARSATLRALQTAKEAGCIISYDPNYRAPLWENEATAVNGMRSVLPYVDVMKLSDEETELLTGIADPQIAAKRLTESGISLVAVTMGDRGALIAVKDGSVTVPAFPAETIDTTGAGDAFFGGLLTCLLESGKHPSDVTLKEAEAFAGYANAAASLCVEKRGAISAMPTHDEIVKRMRSSQTICSRETRT